MGLAAFKGGDREVSVPIVLSCRHSVKVGEGPIVPKALPFETPSLSVSIASWMRGEPSPTFVFVSSEPADAIFRGGRSIHTATASGLPLRCPRLTGSTTT